MIRIVLGMLIMMGAVGHDEYMMEIGEIVPMSETLMKATGCCTHVVGCLGQQRSDRFSVDQRITPRTASKK